MYRLPVSALWIVVFAAVLGHLPSLGFDFAGPDFQQLAVGAGLGEAPAFTPQVWTGLWRWNLWWRVSGADASVPHGAAVLLVALNALLIALTGARIGLSRAGSVLAATLWLIGPNTGLAAASTTAGADLWATFFALAALRVWLAHTPRRDPPLALLLMILSLASGQAALALAPVLWVAGRWFGSKDEDQTVMRGRQVLLGVGLALSLAAWVVLRGQTGTGLQGYSMMPAEAGSRWMAALQQLGSAAWLTPAAPADGVLRLLGAVLLVAGIALGLATRRRADRGLHLALLWTLATLAPAILLPGLELSTGAMAPAAGLALAVGSLLGGPIESLLRRAVQRVRISSALALILVLLLAGPGTAVLRASALGQRVEDGTLSHPLLQAATVSAGVRADIEAVMSSPAPPQQIGILQATRVQLPTDMPLPEGREVIFTSEVHRAVAGATGPRLMVAGRSSVRWTTLLDQLSTDAFVFLDSGGHSLHPLGPVENARIYAALIAVAAGQFDLARHELWSVVEIQGATVRFAFDEDHLPITPDELDAEATNFALVLRDEGSAASLRVLKLFASIYEAVRGQPLIEEGWGDPLRAGRVDR
ncbi:hypothetical protein DRQ53_01435 [bacterium]|nr:MAG: hypothetical protein DRQ53_01435 [bacterium]